MHHKPDQVLLNHVIIINFFDVQSYSVIDINGRTLIFHKKKALTSKADRLCIAIGKFTKPSDVYI